MPFRARYEIERIARNARVSVAEVLEKLETSSWDDYDTLWRELRTVNGKPLEKTKAGVWNCAVNGFGDSDDDSVVTLTAELHKVTSQNSGIYDLILNPPKFERSHRFSRRFGPDRFLELVVPQMPGAQRRAITRWLATTDHYLCGRTWRPFYLENRKATSKGTLTMKVVAFAVDGDDFIVTQQQSPPEKLYVCPPGELSSAHTPMTVDALINWLIPMDKNAHQKDMKLFQRIHLGLSRTTPTAVLRKEEILSVPDMVSSTGEVMNDGCAMMSRSLAQHVASFLDLPNGQVPAAFQARIAGAKGMWIVDRNDSRHHEGSRGFWIEINESQLKILPPPCKDDRELDDEQLTFGVVEWAKPLSPAELNRQVLNVLQHGGIRKDHVERMVKREVEAEYEELKAIVKPKKTFQTRKWLQ
ncbi:hypothetical protein KEM55_005343, partial [Ascosphaera atra]